MTFPRVTAAIFVLLLIGIISLAGVVGVSWIGPTLAHGNHVLHTDGTIINVGPGKDFVLETATKQVLHFQCGTQCRASLGHIQRHIREKAHTDVYYIQGPGTLLAVDVD